MPNLIFVDCETTGLFEDKCFIVEIGMLAVSLPTFEPVAEFSRVVLPPMWPTVKRNLHEKVLQMHQSSGLLGELDHAYDPEGDSGGAAPHIVERQALEFFRDHAPHTPSWQSPMAGANPDFDRRFLRKHMPKLHAAFHYRNFDVRSITQLQDWVFGVQHIESPHRALADCKQAAATVRRFLGC